jgi:hypothetical protein
MDFEINQADDKGAIEVVVGEHAIVIPEPNNPEYVMPALEILICQITGNLKHRAMMEIFREHQHD